jgi:hypothetical protein
LPMVKVSTLFHRVDGFNEIGSEQEDHDPVSPDEEQTDEFLNNLLEALIFDPGEALMQRILQKI